MPRLSILTAAAKVHLCIDAAALEERNAHGRERRWQRDVEAAVAIEIDGILPVSLQPFLIRYKHRYACAVLAFKEQLLADEVALTEVHLRSSVERTLVLLHVVAVDGTGDGERRERIEALGTFLQASEACTAHAGQLYFVQTAAVHGVEIGVARRVLGVAEHHFAVDEVHVFKHILTLGHQLLPVLHAGLADVGHHQAVLGRAVVGVDEHLVTLVFKGYVLVVHVVGHLDELRALHAQVAHIQVVASSGTALVEEHHRLVVVELHAVEAFRVHGVLEEEHIVFLVGAQLVVIDFLYLVHVREFLAFFRRIVGTVEETVLQPVRTGELAPVDMVVEQTARLNVLHVDFHPVGTAARNGVGSIAAVLREANGLQGHRTVVAQLVRVEEHALLAAQLVHRVEHALVLQPVVAVLIPVPLAPEGSTLLAVVRHFLQPFQQLRAHRQLLQVGIRDGVLRLHPPRCLCAGVVL